MTSRSELLRLQNSDETRAYRKALRSMRWRRTRTLWSEFGMKLGHFISPIMLSLVYMTVFLPFGILGRLSKKHIGWRAPQRQANTEMQALRLQA